MEAISYFVLLACFLCIPGLLQVSSILASHFRLLLKLFGAELTADPNVLWYAIFRGKSLLSFPQFRQTNKVIGLNLGLNMDLTQRCFMQGSLQGNINCYFPCTEINAPQKIEMLTGNSSIKLIGKEFYTAACWPTNHIARS